MAYNLLLKKSPSEGDGQEYNPRDQNLQSQNRSHFFSVNRSSSMAGTYRIDRVPDRVPVMNDDSEEDEGWMCRDDEYDSDDLSLETAKKSKWLRDFFEWLNSLSINQISDPTMKLRCPACKNGVGAIAGYKGFQGLLTHAGDVRSKRVRLHQRFAEILREELRNRGSKSSLLVSNTNEEVISSGWKVLGLETDDPLIVWPPMVILRNTRFHKDENDKWVGMGNLELRNCFKQYDIRKVENVYGHGGHCGISLLVFDSSAKGYLEAEHLHKQFLKDGRGKYEWNNNRECVVYGYMATEKDMDLFNKQSKGKQKQKYEMRSYKVMIVDPLKTLEKKVIGLETKVSGSMEVNKILADACEANNRKLELRGHEIEKIRKMATDQWEESKTEMDYMEKHYEDIINQSKKDYEDRINKLNKDLEESEVKRKKLEKTFHSSGFSEPDLAAKDSNH